MKDPVGKHALDIFKAEQKRLGVKYSGRGGSDNLAADFRSLPPAVKEDYMRQAREAVLPHNQPQLQMAKRSSRASASHTSRNDREDELSTQRSIIEPPDVEPELDHDQATDEQLPPHMKDDYNFQARKRAASRTLAAVTASASQALPRVTRAAAQREQDSDSESGTSRIGGLPTPHDDKEERTSVASPTDEVRTSDVEPDTPQEPLRKRKRGDKEVEEQLAHDLAEAHTIISAQSERIRELEGNMETMEVQAKELLHVIETQRSHLVWHNYMQFGRPAMQQAVPMQGAMTGTLAGGPHTLNSQPPSGPPVGGPSPPFPAAGHTGMQGPMPADTTGHHPPRPPCTQLRRRFTYNDDGSFPDLETVMKKLEAKLKSGTRPWWKGVQNGVQVFAGEGIINIYTLRPSCNVFVLDNVTLPKVPVASTMIINGQSPVSALPHVIDMTVEDIATPPKQNRKKKVRAF
eukprot:TRINITY_DN43910_c0_g1_i1.p1 TRINITY_DN43910_c0_g1~~TRINITY_DN43910_c0_g1_i1.p1  ORF type:complete len:461 (+),score=49.25 TRINITY_DN43910_c0_g1_i1:23-1405(+)